MGRRRAWLLIMFLPLMTAFMFLTEGFYTRAHAPYAMACFLTVYGIVFRIFVSWDVDTSARS